MCEFTQLAVGQYPAIRHRWPRDDKQLSIRDAGKDFDPEPLGQTWGVFLAKRSTLQRLALWVVGKLCP